MHILCVTAEFSNGVLGFRLCGTLPYNERRGKEGEGRGRREGQRKLGRKKVRVGTKRRERNKREGRRREDTEFPSTLPVPRSVHLNSLLRTCGSCVSVSSGSSSLKFILVLGLSSPQEQTLPGIFRAW